MRTFSIIALICVLWIPVQTHGQNKHASSRKRAAGSQGKTQLPNVLILGDSIYQQPVNEARKAFKGKAKIVFPAIQPGEIRNTNSAVENFDKLVGQENWELIVFNFGLGDLIYRAPNMKSFRVLPPAAGGVRTTTSDQYRANLTELIAKLKKTKAKLIWASTTPIRHSTTNVFLPGSEVEYNRIAAQLMTENEIPVVDMHSHVKSLINMDRPAAHGADPFHFDKKPIHDPIVKAIQQTLDGKHGNVGDKRQESDAGNSLTGQLQLPEGKGTRGIEIITTFVDPQGKVRQKWLQADENNQFQMSFEGTLENVRVVAGIGSTLVRFESEQLKKKTSGMKTDLGTIDLRRKVKSHQVKVVASNQKTYRMAMWKDQPPRDVSLGSKQFPERETGKKVNWLVPSYAKSLYFLVEEPSSEKRGVQWQTGKHHLFGPFAADKIPSEFKID